MQIELSKHWQAGNMQVKQNIDCWFDGFPEILKANPVRIQ